MNRIFTFIFLLAISLTASAANWVYVDDDRFIDTSSIRKMSNGNTQVWVKNVLTANIIAKIERDLRANGENISYLNYGYSLSLFEISCANTTHGVISGADYDKSGGLISSYTLPERSRKMEPIIPESTGWVTYKKVCKSGSTK